MYLFFKNKFSFLFTYPEIKVIIQSAFATQEDQINSKKAGADDFISKPIDQNTLYSKFIRLFS